MNPRTWPLPIVNAIAAVAAALYLVSFFISVSPSARFQEHRRLGVTRDSDVFRAHPLEFIRYYPAAPGDAYIYFEIGKQYAGKPLPSSTDPVAARLARMDHDPAPIGSRLPYRDFEAVYPPLAVSYFRALSSLTTTFDQFFTLLRVVNLIAVVLMVWLGYRTVRTVTGEHPRGFWAMAVLLVVALGPRDLSFYDALAGLSITLALHEAISRRWIVAGMAIAAGAWLKLFAIFLSPLFLIAAWRDGRSRQITRFIAGGIAVSIFAISPWLLAGDFHFLAGISEQSERRYFEFGSLIGSTLVIFRRLGLLAFEYTSELASLVVASPLSATLMHLVWPAMAAVVSAVALWYLQAAPARSRWLFGCSLTIVAVLFIAPVYSPQYNVILFSVLVIASFLDPRVWPLAAAYFVVGQIQNPLVEGLSPNSRETARAIVFAIRNPLFVWIMWRLWRDTESREPVMERQAVTSAVGL